MKKRLYTLFLVVYLGGLLAALGYPPELADPEDAIVYGGIALLSYLKNTIFGRIPETGSAIDVMLHLLGFIDLLLFFLFIGTALYAAEKLSKALNLPFHLGLLGVGLLLFTLFLAGTMLLIPELIPLSIFLAAIPFIIFEYFVCAECK